MHSCRRLTLITVAAVMLLLSLIGLCMYLPHCYYLQSLFDQYDFFSLCSYLKLIHYLFIFQCCLSLAIGMQ